MDGTNKALFGPGGNCDRFALEGNKNSQQAPAWVRSNGFDAYEYEAGRGVPRNLSILQAVGDEARKNGIHMSLHAPYFISLSSESPETQEQNLRIITESLQAAEAVGARTIVVHSGGAGKADRRDAMKRSLDMLVRIASLSVPNGLKIGIETMGKINQLGTVDEVIEQCLVCPDLFVPVVDFGHLNARENGCFAVPDDYTRVFERIARSLGDGQIYALPFFQDRIHGSRRETAPDVRRQSVRTALRAFRLRHRTERTLPDGHMRIRRHADRRRAAPQAVLP